MVNEMTENIIKNKQFAFAIRFVKHYQFLFNAKKCEAFTNATYLFQTKLKTNTLANRWN